MLRQEALQVDLSLPPAFFRFLDLAKTILNFFTAAGEEGFILLKNLPGPLQVLVEVLLLFLEGDQAQLGLGDFNLKSLDLQFQGLQILLPANQGFFPVLFLLFRFLEGNVILPGLFLDFDPLIGELAFLELEGFNLLMPTL